MLYVQDTFPVVDLVECPAGFAFAFRFNYGPVSGTRYCIDFYRPDFFIDLIIFCNLAWSSGRSFSQ
jgi:hypothetical protein